MIGIVAGGGRTDKPLLSMLNLGQTVAVALAVFANNFHRGVSC
jgi:hypothetical protein